MACLRATVLATTVVELIALATPAFAEVIITPDGHYYKLFPLKAPPGQASSVVMAVPEGATANVAPASPWPIYNGFYHQPTENELRGSPLTTRCATSCREIFLSAPPFPNLRSLRPPRA
jgi:hypothetical protein